MSDKLKNAIRKRLRDSIDIDKHGYIPWSVVDHELYDDEKLEARVEEDFQWVESVYKELKKHGFNRRDTMHNSAGQVNMWVYDTSRGVLLICSRSYRRGFEPTKESYVAETRQPSGKYYRTVHNVDSLEKAIAQTKGLKGASKKVPKNRELKWRSPTDEPYEIKNGDVFSNNILRSAKCIGFCKINEKHTLDQRDMERPDMDDDTYFMVEANDHGMRTLYFVFNCLDEYLIALPRGLSRSLVEDDVLFKNGHHPLYLSRVGTRDMEILGVAVQTFLGDKNA